jgi:hypothetical protein
MADILIYSGDAGTPQELAPVVEGLPLSDIAARLGLEAGQWVTPPGEPPFINRQSGGWSEEKDRYVLALVGADEAPWKPGYYLLAITAPEAYRALGIPHPQAA